MKFPDEVSLYKYGSKQLKPHYKEEQEQQEIQGFDDFHNFNLNVQSFSLSLIMSYHFVVAKS